MIAALKWRDTRVSTLFAALALEVADPGFSAEMLAYSDGLAAQAELEIAALAPVAGASRVIAELEALALTARAANAQAWEQWARLNEQAQAQIWPVITEVTGIRRGDTVTLRREYSDDVITVVGALVPRLSKKYGTATLKLVAYYGPNVEGPVHPNSFTEFSVEDLASLLDPLPPERAAAVRANWAKGPSTLVGQLEAALAGKHPFFERGQWNGLGHEILRLADCPESWVLAELGMTPQVAREATITLDFDITSKDNFIIEWYSDNERANQSVAVSQMLGYYRPNRLVQLRNAYDVFKGGALRYRSVYRGEQLAYWDEGWTLLVNVIYETLTAFLAVMRRVCKHVYQPLVLELVSPTQAGELPVLHFSKAPAATIA